MGICQSFQKSKFSNISDEQIYSFKKRFKAELKPAEFQNRKLSFEIHLHSIKAKGLDDNYYLCKIVFAYEKFTYILPISQGPNPKFNLNEELFVELYFSELETKFFDIYLYSISKTTDIMKIGSIDQIMKNRDYISKISIDLLTIAVGPEHHDIHLYDKSKKAYQGRMNFNINCNHIENVSIQVSSMKCLFNQEMHNELGFALKFKSENGMEYYETDNTDPIKPSINIKENFSEYKYLNLGEQDNNNLVIEDLLLSLNELRASSLNLKIFDTRMAIETIDTQMKRVSMTLSGRKKTIKPDNPKSSFASFSIGNLNVQNVYKEFAHVRMNFFKILSQNDNKVLLQESKVFQAIAPLYTRRNSAMIVNENIGTQINSNTIIPSLNKLINLTVFDNIERNFEDEILHEGKTVGKIECGIRISSIPLMRQILCGVHTEKGLDLNSNFLSLVKNEQNQNGDSLPDEIVRLKKLSQDVSSFLLDFPRISPVTNDSMANKHEISNSLVAISYILKKTVKETSLFYNYENDTQIIKSQEIILVLGIDIISILDSLSNDNRGYAIQVLESILERGEFDLPSMSIYSTETNQEKKQMKIKISGLFLKFMVKCLKFSLNKLAKKIPDEGSKSFVELFLSIAYFRLPRFRKIFLDVISSDLDLIDDNLYESMLRERKLSIHDDSERQNSSEIVESDYNPIVMLVDWEKIFYSRYEKLIDRENLKEIYKELDLILDKPEWRDRLKRRGLVFLTIIRKLDYYIQRKLVVQKNINWTHIQGFKIIIQALIHEIQKRDISRFHQILIDVLKTFINDSDIMNMFSSIIINKTNAYDPSSVYKTFKIIDCFFQEYESKQTICNFSVRFDYLLLKKSFEHIINTDHSLCISKILWFYYRNATIVSLEHLHDFLQNLFNIYFFKLFFHWSFNVRNAFFYFIIFILKHKIRMSFESVQNQRNKIPRKAGAINGNTDLAYSQKLKSSIFENLDNKMNKISKIKGLVESMTNETISKLKYQNDSEWNAFLGEVNYKNILIAVDHFNSVEIYFRKWELEQNNKNVCEYPELNLQPPKDDYVEYRETW